MQHTVPSTTRKETLQSLSCPQKRSSSNPGFNKQLLSVLFRHNTSGHGLDATPILKKHSLNPISKLLTPTTCCKLNARISGLKYTIQYGCANSAAHVNNPGALTKPKTHLQESVKWFRLARVSLLPSKRGTKKQKLVRV